MSDINKTPKDIDLTHEYFKDKKVSLIKSGNNRTIYYLENKENQKHIVKKSHMSKDSGSTNLNDIISQNFINYMGYDFVPKIISYDSDYNLHVELYVGEKDAILDKLDKKQLDIFAKQLWTVHSLPIDKYYEFCAEQGFDRPKMISPSDNLNTHGFERFKIVKKLCPDKQVIGWINNNLEQSRFGLSSRPTPQYHLIWGDIGGNLRITGSKLYFIDWEFSRLGSGSELPYIKIHSHLLPDQLDYLISQYSKYSGVAVQELYDEIKHEEKIIRVNDVIWAAMRWGQAKSVEDINIYKNLTYRRIEIADNIN